MLISLCVIIVNVQRTQSVAQNYNSSRRVNARQRTVTNIQAGGKPTAKVTVERVNIFGKLIGVRANIGNNGTGVKLLSPHIFNRNFYSRSLCR